MDILSTTDLSKWVECKQKIQLPLLYILYLVEKCDFSHKNNRHECSDEFCSDRTLMLNLNTED